MINENKQQRQIINKLKIEVDSALDAKGKSQGRYLEASTQTEWEVRLYIAVLISIQSRRRMRSHIWGP